MPDGADLERLLASFAELVAEHEERAAPEEAADTDTNFRCVDCTDCSECRFCTSCERCVECTYCDACIDCEGCTQSRECLGCAKINQSTHSAYCEESSYLTLCLDCDNCVQCFACVGLSGKEFHILNQKYRRGEYFKKVNELRAALDAKALEGWFPPWSDVASVPEPESEPDAMSDSFVDFDSEADAQIDLDSYVDEPEVSASVRPAPAAPVAEPGLTSRPGMPFDEPSPEQTGEVREPGVPRTVDTASEYTGSWPPVDHASARAFDRQHGDDPIWRELEPEAPPPQAPAAESADKPPEEMDALDRAFRETQEIPRRESVEKPREAVEKPREAVEKPRESVEKRREAVEESRSESVEKPRKARASRPIGAEQPQTDPIAESTIPDRTLERSAAPFRFSTPSAESPRSAEPSAPRTFGTEAPREAETPRPAKPATTRFGGASSSESESRFGGSSPVPTPPSFGSSGGLLPDELVDPGPPSSGRFENERAPEPAPKESPRPVAKPSPMTHARRPTRESGSDPEPSSLRSAQRPPRPPK